jgi:hypothetical protein
VLDATAATIAGTATTQGKLVELDQIASLMPGKDPDAAWLIQQELLLVAGQANELLRLSWLLDPLKLTSRH